MNTSHTDTLEDPVFLGRAKETYDEIPTFEGEIDEVEQALEFLHEFEDELFISPAPDGETIEVGAGGETKEGDEMDPLLRPYFAIFAKDADAHNKIKFFLTPKGDVQRNVYKAKVQERMQKFHEEWCGSRDPNKWPVLVTYKVHDYRDLDQIFYSFYATNEEKVHDLKKMIIVNCLIEPKTKQQKKDYKYVMFDKFGNFFTLNADQTRTDDGNEDDTLESIGHKEETIDLFIVDKKDWKFQWNMFAKDHNQKYPNDNLREYIEDEDLGNYDTELQQINAWDMLLPK